MISAADQKVIREIIGLIRMKGTFRFQGEDYSEQGGEYRLGLDATNHLREILALSEKALALLDKPQSDCAMEINWGEQAIEALKRMKKAFHLVECPVPIGNDWRGKCRSRLGLSCSNCPADTADFCVSVIEALMRKLPVAPQPESAGDADKLLADLKNILIPTTEHFPQTQDAIAKGVIQAFASRIRAETLEEAAKIVENIGDRVDHVYRAANTIRDLKPTDTP